VGKMSLTINLVTRNRPHRMLECVRRTLPNISRNDTVLMISVDDDDRPTMDALRNLPLDDRIVPWVMPREDSLGEKYNRAMAFPALVYTTMSDYCAHCTVAFDQRLLGAAAYFPDNIGVVFSHMANFSFPGIQGMTHGLVEKLGYIYPPHFPYWFVDHWLDDIAKLIDRVSFADVQLDVANKLPTQEMRDLVFWTTFFDACRLVRRKQARDIIDSDDFIEPEWRKEILRRHYPLTEYRSQWINDSIRENARAYERGADAGAGGERYNRLKAKALEMMNQLSPALEEDLEKAA
jgi:hypothetical protein